MVVRDGAVLYDDDHSDERVRELSRGEFVVGCTVEFLGEFTYGRFDEDEGRWRVTWVDPERGKWDHGWMDPDDLATFTYRCCKFACTPFEKKGWERCFREAAEAKWAELEKKSSPGKASKAEKAEKAEKSAAPRSGERALTNADVVALAGAGVGDAAVIAKIRQAPAESLDVSTEAILELRAKGVSGAVIQAMVERAGARR
ncbi:MAG TPA: hypothetical protein VLA75_02420 [Thermoanaerobaculia bacterium]|nr:hypothetical protein [Thermoanaerobaculia bacterium]